MGLDNPIHIAFLVVILLLLFGARRLPEIGRSLGTGMREFKDSISGSSQSSQPQQPTLTQQTQAPMQAAPQPAPVQVAQPVAQPVAPVPQQPADAAQPAPAEASPAGLTGNPFGG